MSLVVQVQGRIGRSGIFGMFRVWILCRFRVGKVEPGGRAKNYELGEIFG